MSKRSVFVKSTRDQFRTLKQYVPVVERVHGSHHPEFYEVRKTFDLITDKVFGSAQEDFDLSKEFLSLREITNDYTVPGDVCESYEAVYVLLSEIDRAYQEQS